MDYLSTPSTTDESENASRNNNGQSLSISSVNSSNSVSTRTERSRKRLRLDFLSESEIESEEENTREQTSSKIKKKVEKIHGKLMAFILSNNLPFKIVESVEFQDFIDSIKNNYYKLPCRQTSGNLKMKLKLEFDAVEYGSITTDCWSSNSNLSYMGITFHYLDNSMHLTSRYLCLKYMEESHSAIYLKECLEKVLLSWNLRDKVYGVVTDSAANIKAALELFSGNIQRIPCAAHKLHLCVNDLFKIKNIKFKLDKERNREMAFIRDVDKDGCSRDLMIDEITQNQITSINAIKNELLNPLMSKCRRLVGSFKHSDSLTRILKEKQTSLESPNKTKLIQDVSTRWNTSYDMMYSILINKNALVSMSLDRENSVIRQNMPTEIEFIILQDLC
ncbi:unnamed protein product [Brachionus calyciflorus]|uniref:Uncharacterized protein n=1 Tax=Brachionus calyciflorus TaxID=104777 RepID=A0A814MI62_9BILA|nr:unnamed protein product [Brachionus calyciflorus]